MLQKKLVRRTVEDIEQLMSILQDITFFKEMDGLTRFDYRELAAAF